MTMTTEVDEVSEAEQPRERTPLPEFLREVRAELRRVNWPGRQQIVSYTVVVLVLTLVLTTFVWGADEGIRRIVLNTLG
jgi:preprotein translocase subunit SecE